MTSQSQAATPQAPPPSEQFDLWIEAGRVEKNYWSDLWRYRELFYFLAWRDLLVRYKQTVVGVAWALIRRVLDRAGENANCRPIKALWPLFRC